MSLAVRENAADTSHLHKAVSRDCRAQEVHKVGKLTALELLMKLDDELQVLGAEARGQAWLPGQACSPSCSFPGCMCKALPHKAVQTEKFP